MQVEMMEEREEKRTESVERRKQKE